MLEYLPIPALIIGALVYAWWRKAYLTQVIVISNFFIFLYLFFLLWDGNSLGWGLVDAYTFVPARLGQIEYSYSIITSMFMHISPLHLIGNILVLYLIGLPLEERVGSKNWGIIYFATGMAATMMFFLFHPSAETYLLGASGAIYGLGGALLILYPRDRIPMFIGPIFSTQAPVWLAVGIMFVTETILVSMAVQDGTAHVAHVGGMVCGIFLAPALVKLKKKEQGNRLDFELLRKMVIKPEDSLVLEKVERETEPDVQKAWLEFFFKEAARCPKCRRHLGELKEKIECECGETYRIRV